ncbi:hypothetical protein N9N97_03180, partial [Rickettsiaceae bacterium]|nr:hypothetical protein [Rickettsiaceae bacterium]
DNRFKLTILGTAILTSCQALAEVPLKLDLGGFAGNNRNYVQAGAFLPISQNEDGLLFGDIRGMKHLPHFKKQNKSIYKEDTYEFNFGLGYRRIIHQDLVLGGVVYYDIRKAQLKNATLSQATLNAHVLSSTWQSNLNLYIPIGKKKITKSSHVFQNEARIINNDVFFKYKDHSVTENALKGVDFRISTTVPNMDSLRVGPVVYYFKGNKSVAGGGMEVNWAYNDSINIESSITYDKLRKTNFVAGVRFTFPSSTAGKARPVDNLLSTRVERDIDLVTSSQTANLSTQEKQKNAVALNNQQLSDINNPNKLDENKELLNKLLLAVDNDGKIIITDDADGDVITIDETNTFTSKSLSSAIATAKSGARAKLDNNTTEAQLVDNSIKSTKNTIEKVADLVATEQAIREKSGFKSIFVAGQSVSITPNQEFLDSLVKKFSSDKSSASQSYYIDLPGYGNVEVKRAGTMLVVKQGAKDYMVVGVDAYNAQRHANTGNQPYSTWFTGGLEAKDGGVYEGLMRETFEESVGTVYITKSEFNNAIKNKQFMYDPSVKTLAIVKHDSSGTFDVNSLNAKLSKMKQDRNVSGSFKEIKEYTLVHPGELRSMANSININQSVNAGNITRNPHNAIYKINNIKNNVIRLDKNYADSFYRANGVKALSLTIGSFPSG